MDFNLSEELQMLRDMVRDFATEKIAPFASDWDEKHYFPYESTRPLQLIRRSSRNANPLIPFV